MKKEINDVISKTISSLKYTLLQENFCSYLRDVVDMYTINKQFIVDYSEYLDMTKLSDKSLTRDAVKYLMSNGLLDYDAWLSRVEYNDITILLDDDFVSAYDVDVYAILSSAKNIPASVFEKYKDRFLTREMIFRAPKDIVSAEFALAHKNILGDDIWFLESVKNDLKSENSIMKKYIYNKDNKLSILDYIHYLSLTNDEPDEETYDAFNFDYAIFDDSEYEIGKHYLRAIINRYSTEFVCSLINDIILSDIKLLESRELLLDLILLHTVPESIMCPLVKTFLSLDLKDQLVEYAKANDMPSVLLSLKL